MVEKRQKIEAILDKNLENLSVSEADIPEDKEAQLPTINITSFEALNQHIEAELKAIKSEALENQIERYQSLKESAGEAYFTLLTEELNAENELISAANKEKTKEEESDFWSFLKPEKKTEPSTQIEHKPKTSNIEMGKSAELINVRIDDEIRDTTNQEIAQKKNEILSNFDASLNEFETKVNELKSISAPNKKTTSLFIEELKKHRDNFNDNGDADCFKAEITEACLATGSIYNKKTWFKENIAEPFEKLKNSLYQLIGQILNKPGLFQPQPSLLDEYKTLQSKLENLEEKAEQKIQPSQ
ncbi:MAG: hypothetical protein QNK11_05590 [Legionella sp.]|nr:hypothetical protein [Legionella sp.]